MTRRIVPLVISAIRIVLLVISAILGIFAAGLGGYHGYGEILQGDVIPPGVFINAFGGPDCPPAGDAMCFPAMTILPTNFRVVGIVTVIVAIITLISVIATIRGIGRGLGLLLSSIALLLVGGGFLAPILGIIGAIAGFFGTRK